MNEIADVALNAASTGGASYADIRICRHKDQTVHTREERVEGVSDTESYGLGVRVLVDGTWGFAASPVVTRDEAAATTARALAIARANRAIQRRPVELAPAPSHVDEWHAPVDVDPFTVPIADKIELLLAVNAEALKVPGASYCNAAMHFRKEEKFFASTEGSRIRQTLVRSWPTFTVTAVDSDRSEFETRTADVLPIGRGYEFVHEADLVSLARPMAEQAVEKLAAPSVEPGRRALILHPSNLWLTIHESCGHPTELDRACGLEANFAGTSFLTPDKLGKLKYGSDIVNFVGEKVRPGGLATCGYDDDGTQTHEFPIVKDGVFVDYLTVREQVTWPEYRQARAAAGLPEATRSNACAYADRWGIYPIQRMPNIHLLPGTQPLSPDGLIAATDDGIYIVGDSSYSIDHQRYNFQFSGQAFYQIKHGKIAGMVKDVAYQANTQDFWNACDAICDERFFELGGTYYCGKNQPMQSSSVSHGCAPARFHQVNILNTRRQV
ncbi:TldD/PmbA family protein [bacterium]|nr:TldD/PmbA family protein [bacterium]